MNIFNYLDYREIINLKLQSLHGSYRTLALSSDIHSSYFSRVMTGKTEFSSEQLYKLARLLELKADEVEYLLLLGELNRSGSKEHKEYLKSKIQKIRETKLKLKENLNQVEALQTSALETQKYYFEALTAKVHMYLCLPKYQSSPESLANKLGISNEKLESELAKLASLGLIRRKKNEVVMLKDSVHLDEGDLISPTNHINWRLEAISNITKRQTRISDYHFTVCFTANDEVKMAIKQSFKDFLIETQKKVGQVKNSDQVYYMTFDLFEDEI